MAEDFIPTERLHPLSWLFAVVGFIRQFLIPLIFAAVFGPGDGMPVWIAWAIVPMIGAAVLRQLNYRYGFGPDGLVIREGILFRNVRQIDYRRIENVDTQRNPLHRLFDVAEVRIETSTGGKPEAQIEVLSVPAAHALRERLSATRSEASTSEQQEASAEVSLLHLPPIELVRFGLIDNRGMVVLAGLFGLAQQAGLLEVWGILLRDYFTPAQLDAVIAWGWMLQFAAALVTFVFSLILVRVFSIALAFVTLYDFTLTRVGADLRAHYGLLTRVALTIRAPRIQAIHQSETLLHRWFDRVSLRVDLAGDSGPSEHQQGASQKVRWLAPLIVRDRALPLANLALPEIDLTSDTQWQPLSDRARGRVFRRSVATWIAIVSIAALLLRDVRVLLLLGFALPLSWSYAVYYTRFTRWALKRDVLLFREGWLKRTLVIVPRNRVQCALFEASPFDRRHRMARVVIDTAGGGRDSVRIPYLDKHVAAALTEALYLSSAGAQRASVEGIEIEAV